MSNHRPSSNPVVDLGTGLVLGLLMIVGFVVLGLCLGLRPGFYGF